MTEITLTAGEVAQVHLRLFRIQKASKEGRETYIYNQARCVRYRGDYCPLEDLSPCRYVPKRKKK